MLKITHIAKTFNPGTITEKKALTDVSLTLNEGDFVTVIGGNGAGKSTMLNAVAGVFPVDRGTIEIGGTDVTRLPEYKRARYLGRVFQDPMTGTAATMNIEENMALAYRRGQPRGLRWGVGAKEREPRPGGPHGQQGRPAQRRPASGADPAHGHAEDPAAPPAG